MCSIRMVASITSVTAKADREMARKIACAVGLCTTMAADAPIHIDEDKHSPRRNSRVRRPCEARAHTMNAATPGTTMGRAPTPTIQMTAHMPISDRNADTSSMWRSVLAGDTTIASLAVSCILQHYLLSVTDSRNTTCCASTSMVDRDKTRCYTKSVLFVLRVPHCIVGAWCR